jgi:uncharacterized protein YlbG (UPF0298 family)
MAITAKKKKEFNDRVKKFKEQVDELKKSLVLHKKKIKEHPRLQAYYKIAYALDTLKIVNLYCQMSDLSLEILNLKNETYLNNARKEIYNVFIPIEDVLGKDIDAPLNHNLQNLEYIKLLSPAQKLSLIQKINFNISSVIDRFGSNSKWKWNFVEFHSRAAVLSKNIINFREMQKNRDPRTKYYMERLSLLRICKDALREASDENRNKYELSTKVPGDMIKSIEFLSALRNIHGSFGESDEAQKLKTGIDVLRQRLEKDEKEKEAKKKI